MKPNVRTCAMGCVLFVTCVVSATGADAPLPRPGVGVFFKAEEVEALRKKVQSPPCKEIYDRLRKQADDAMATWLDDKVRLRLDEIAPKLPDLAVEFTPKEYLPEGGKEAGTFLEKAATEAAPRAAFVYLITGDRRYASYAWSIFQLCAQTGRWGWFPWAGSQVPHIHYGIISRNLVLVADCVWDTLTPEQRHSARQVLCEKCVEPYYRILLQTPGMGLYHLRSRNQGSNVLAAALVASLFVGDEVPDNRVFFNSLLQTYHWAITSDIGWMGQGLESGLGGYWTVSMQNLYTAAAALYNVRGIDLRGHPGFEQATWYPIVHETTVPPVDFFTKPIDANSSAGATPGIIAGKPIELPGRGTCGPWWFDYAVKFPDSPAHYFAAKDMITPKGLRAADGHQAALSDVLTIAWWDDRLLAKPAAPRGLAQFTNRMAGIRSAYGCGGTYLYFNGDMFLSARNEILCTTSGMAWHYPWHQYQIAETGIETEGEPMAPSMVLKDSRSDGRFTWFRAVSGPSNVAYYPSREQRESWEHYDRRERRVLHVRPADGESDYFVFVDDVRHKDAAPRWHAWTWHLWNSRADTANYGRFTPAGPAAVRAERPNADLWIQFLQPAAVTFEQHGVPAQPHVSYQMDHHGQMLRAIACGAGILPATGEAGKMPASQAEAKAVTISPSAWQGLGEVQDGALYLAKPPTEKDFATSVVAGLTPGARYRLSLRCKEENYRVYEATAWEVSLELLDAAGKVVAKPTTRYGQPHPLRLGAPLSDTKTHDWTETVQYFDAPAAAVACRASFRAVGGAHYFELGKLWLGPVELQPVGTPQRAREQRFVVVVMPLAKRAAPPRITTGEDGRTTTVALAGGTVDEITVAADGALKIVRRKAGKELTTFDEPASSMGTGTESANNMPIRSQSPSAEAGSGGLRTNSDASAASLRAGLESVLDDLAAQRDRLTAKGAKNFALTAKVTASASLDERFAPAHVIDNRTAEYPEDGHLDYTLGVVWSSSRFAGYGEGKESLLTDRDNFPLYVRPSYWLLPEDKLGWVELELPAASPIGLVRLLNTSNAGLNDFATHRFRVTILDAERKPLATRDGAFGKVYDAAFSQAFIVPKWFSRYTPTFAGMLEPGLTVPFGDGWQELAFDNVQGAKFVRVEITKFWGIGGGLNEVQVYAKTEKKE